MTPDQRRPTRVRPWSALIVATVSFLPTAGCQEGANETAVPSSPASTLWRTLGTWSGRGDRQTPSFDITTGALRITWEASGIASPEAGSLRVTLHSAISGRPLETVVEVEGTGIDTVRLAADPRVAYLLVESDLVEWRLTVEEGVSAATPRRP